MDKINRNYLYLTIVILLAFNFWLWPKVLAAGLPDESAVYFIDVGQGDSQLLVSNGIKILIDGGRDGKVLEALGEIIGGGDKYIDLVVATHFDLDHYGGLTDVMRNYDVGYFIHNGQTSPAAAYQQLLAVISERAVPDIVLAAKDKIKHKENAIGIIWPDGRLAAKLNSNEASLVMLAKINGERMLFAGDIGFEAENRLFRAGADLNSDILKVAHHGSRYSSGDDFIKAARPKISAIGVGKNSYGHPAGRVLKALAAVNSVIYRTDMDGTVKISLNPNGKLPKPRFEYKPIYYPVTINRVSPYSEISAADEFVKLRNNGAGDINLGGWSLVKQTKSGKEYILASSKKFSGVAPAGGEFMIAHPDYRGAEIPDLFYSNKSNSLAKSGNNILLYDDQGNLVDKYEY